MAGENTTSESRQTRQQLISVGLMGAAFLVPIWGLIWSTGSHSTIWPAPAVPFAMGRIVIVHVVAGFPLAWWFAGLLCRRRGALSDQMRLLGPLTGAGLAVASMYSAQAIGESIAGLQFYGRDAVRVVWVFLLQLPWCWTVRAHFLRIFKSPPPRPTLLDCAIGVTAATLVPLAYIDSVIERQSRIAAEAMYQEQILQAWEITNPLQILASQHPIMGTPFDRFRRDLHQQLLAITQQVQQPLPADASSERRITRARQWFRIGRSDEAQQVLGRLPQSDAQASLLQAVIAETQGDLAGAVHWAQHTVQLSEAADSAYSAETREDLRLQAYTRWSMYLRRLGRFQEAAQVLHDVADAWPEQRGRFLYQLGLHYQMAGRPNDAITHFRQAAEHDPAMRDLAAQEIQRLSDQAEGCLLRTPRPTTR